MGCVGVLGVGCVRVGYVCGWVGFVDEVDGVWAVCVSCVMGWLIIVSNTERSDERSHFGNIQ